MSFRVVQTCGRVSRPKSQDQQQFSSPEQGGHPHRGQMPDPWFIWGKRRCCSWITSLLGRSVPRRMRGVRAAVPRREVARYSHRVTSGRGVRRLGVFHKRTFAQPGIGVDASGRPSRSYLHHPEGRNHCLWEPVHRRQDLTGRASTSETLHSRGSPSGVQPCYFDVYVGPLFDEIRSA